MGLLSTYMPPLDYFYKLKQEEAERQIILKAYKEPVFKERFEDAIENALKQDPIVIAPYVYDYPEHLEAIAKVGYPVTRIPCPTETSYYDALVAVYQTGKTMVTIEHDMLPRPNDVKELLECPHEWCGFIYRHRFQRMKACLGLTKLDFHDKYPNIFETVVKDWRYIDGVLEARLFEKGMKIHEHFPEVQHSNPLVSVDGPEVDSSPEGLMQRSLFLARGR